MAIRDCSSRFIVSSAFNESWKVLGSMFGKRRRAKGKTNSINGMRMNIEKGTRRNKSETVRSNCFRSLRVNVDPDSVLAKRLRAVRTSAIKSYMINNKQTPKDEVSTCSHLGTELHADATVD
jgi:hypothetical protein